MVKDMILIKVMETMKDLDIKPQHLVTLTNVANSMLVTIKGVY